MGKRSSGRSGGSGGARRGKRAAGRAKGRSKPRGDQAAWKGLAVGRRIGYAVGVVGFLGAVITVALLLVLNDGDPSMEQAILSAYRAGEQYAALEIAYPLDGAVFPPEIVAPTFRWKDDDSDADTWLVSIEFADGEPSLMSLCGSMEWTPSADDWETIKARSSETVAEVTVLGVQQSAPNEVLSAGKTTLSTSRDEVGAPLFYREVNLPFIEAVKDPSQIRWRFGKISSPQQPPVVLENLPVCGNCHSFSADGSVLGMDVDYANDKGSYAIAQTTHEIVLTQDNVITWSDYRREEGTPTFGLLSQVSPDGKYVISTVKDRSVFVATPGMEFSQLFFPIRGILAVHDRETGEFSSLPGADDPRFVQSNAAWSPDGKSIVFARSKAHPLRTIGDHVLLTAGECREFLRDGKKFMFDLYRIPFNEGKGGKPEPLEGASNNGMSNFFPKYSPDGKWIVFCRAKSFMLLQPDSELYIVPATGGNARRLRCNTSPMNSWHSWSPNGKWLVFSSKANGAYTQLWLTHVDEEGRSTRPVWLSHFTASDRAANIPEFVNAEADAIGSIREQFVDDHSFVRAAREFLRAGDLDEATRFCRKALEFNPKNVQALNQLGNLLLKKRKPEQARVYLAKAVAYEPGYATAHINLGVALRSLGDLPQAAAHFRKAVDVAPHDAHAHNSLAVVLSQLEKPHEAIKYYMKAIEIDPDQHLFHHSGANALMKVGRLDDAVRHFERAVRINPQYAPAHRNCALALVRLDRVAEAVVHLEKAIEIAPEQVGIAGQLAWLLATSPSDSVRNGAKAVRLAERACAATGHKDPQLLDTLAAAYAEAGRFSEAIATATKAAKLAEAGKSPLAGPIRRRLALYEAGTPCRDRSGSSRSRGQE